jgi:transposase-like protein
MGKHKAYSTEFKRQVAADYLQGRAGCERALAAPRHESLADSLSGLTFNALPYP